MACQKMFPLVQTFHWGIECLLGTERCGVYNKSMIHRVTLADCASMIGDYLESRLTHAQVVDWAREAMMAQEMPPHEQSIIVDLLQDISLSTPSSLASAARNYRKLMSPLLLPASLPGRLQ